MIVKLVEIVETKQAHSQGPSGFESTFSLREVFVNPDQVVCLREEHNTKRALAEGKMPDLDQAQQFTRIQMNRGNSGMDIVVVGSPHTVEEKIFKTQSRLLRG